MMEASEDTARRYFLYYATAGAGVVATGATLWPLVNQMNPSADVRALAQITVDISDLAPGTQLTVNWRGKSVFIRHRTEAEIAQAWADAVYSLPDSKARNPNLPADALGSDENRAVVGHEAYLVMIGVCTHLGCVPLGDEAGGFGGSGSAPVTVPITTRPGVFAKARHLKTYIFRTWRSPKRWC